MFFGCAEACSAERREESGRALFFDNARIYFHNPSFMILKIVKIITYSVLSIIEMELDEFDD